MACVLDGLIVVIAPLSAHIQVWGHDSRPPKPQS